MDVGGYGLLMVFMGVGVVLVVFGLISVYCCFFLCRLIVMGVVVFVGVILIVVVVCD